MENSNMNKTKVMRKVKDTTLNVLTYLSASISVIILAAIIIFIFVKGSSYFSFKMIVSDYNESVYFGECETSSSTTFTLENKDGIYYSNHFGIGLKDSHDLEGNDIIEIVYVDSASPLKNMKKQNSDETLSVKKGQAIKRVQIVSEDNNLGIYTAKIKAEQMALALDTGYVIQEIYFATIGGGIRGSLISTIYLILLTLIIVLPIGVIAAIYLSNYAKENKLTKIIRTLIDMISGIPSIIFGFIGVIIFIPIVSSITKTPGGSIISGALTMAIMLLPLVIKNTEDAIENIPKGYKMSSLALGASETQTTLKIILPNAIPGILTAVLLSIGRIIGESAALIFAIGTVISDKVSLGGSSTTLAVHIWSVMSGENPNYSQACAISIIIMIVVLILNILVKLLCKKFRRYEVK